MFVGLNGQFGKYLNFSGHISWNFDHHYDENNLIAFSTPGSCAIVHISWKILIIIMMKNNLIAFSTPGSYTIVHISWKILIIIMIKQLDCLEYTEQLLIIAVSVSAG